MRLVSLSLIALAGRVDCSSKVLIGSEGRKAFVAGAYFAVGQPNVISWRRRPAVGFNTLKGRVRMVGGPARVEVDF